MKIQYNAPVILNFTFLCAAVLFLQNYSPFEVMEFFTVRAQNPDYADPFFYVGLVSHAAGHGNWDHLIGNFTIILLVGPILEEKYGSRDLLFMMLFTALLTGILQVAFFKVNLLGASGIVFMMILLSSFANAKAGTIPLTFILVAILFLGKEITSILNDDNISQFAHIIGGICGAIFGFALMGPKRKKEIGSKLPT